MYKNPCSPDQLDIEFDDFVSPFPLGLDAENRWIQLARLIPWKEFEYEYSLNFGKDGFPAHPFRMALGSLIAKEILRVSDRDLVQQIKENPYLQFFIGLPSFQTTAPFHAATLTYFRKRISDSMLRQVNERIYEKNIKDRDQPAPPSGCSSNSENSESEKKPNSEIAEKENKGALIIDATCVPEDIHYPRDIHLLNETRIVTEKVVDFLWKAIPKKDKSFVKPRTYRTKAKKDYMNFVKRKKGKRKVAYRRGAVKACRIQLRYIRRNLESIRNLIKAGDPGVLQFMKKSLYRNLLVASEVYRQQCELNGFSGNKANRSVSDRIVNLWKPHVRPIIRGKSSAEVEFGAKISISIIDGFAFLDRLSWDAYNEGADLKKQAEEFHRRTGYFPESIHADKIYRTRENLQWCKSKGIRLSGPKLGRPYEEKELSREQKQKEYEDNGIRNAVEGKFGEGKRRYSLSRIMTRLRNCSETVISLAFMVMNLSKILRDLLFRIIFEWLGGLSRLHLRLRVWNCEFRRIRGLNGDPERIAFGIAA